MLNTSKRSALIILFILAAGCDGSKQAEATETAERQPIDLSTAQQLGPEHTSKLDGLSAPCTNEQVVDALWQNVVRMGNPSGNFTLDASRVERAKLPKMEGRAVALLYSWSPGDKGVRSSAIETSFVDSDCEAAQIDLKFLD